MPLRHHHGSQERRITYNICKAPGVDDVFPINGECIGLHNVVVVFEGEDVEAYADDVGCLLHHLIFGNPQSRLSDGYSEVVYFDTIELAETDAYGREIFAEIQLGMSLSLGTEGFVFKAPQRDVTLGQEVA